MIVEVRQQGDIFYVVGPDGTIIIDRAILEQIEFSAFTPPVAYFMVEPTATNTTHTGTTAIYTNVVTR